MIEKFTQNPEAVSKTGGGHIDSSAEKAVVIGAKNEFKPGDHVFYTTLKGDTSEYKIIDYSLDKPVDDKNGLILKNLKTGKVFAISPAALERVYEMVDVELEEDSIDRVDIPPIPVPKKITVEKMADYGGTKLRSNNEPAIARSKSTGLHHPQYYEPTESRLAKERQKGVGPHRKPEEITVEPNIAQENRKPEEITVEPNIAQENGDQFSEQDKRWFRQGKEGRFRDEYEAEEAQAKPKPEVVKSAKEYVKKFEEAEKIWKELVNYRKVIERINAGGMFNRRANFIGRLQPEFNPHDDLEGLSGLEIQNFIKFEKKLIKLNRNPPSNLTRYVRGKTSREIFHNLQNASWIK